MESRCQDGRREHLASGRGSTSQSAPTVSLSVARVGCRSRRIRPRTFQPTDALLSTAVPGKDPVWELDVTACGDELVYREDPLLPGVHGFVEPSAPMTLEQYESALLATRPVWRLP